MGRGNFSETIAYAKRNPGEARSEIDALISATLAEPDTPTSDRPKRLVTLFEFRSFLDILGGNEDAAKADLRLASEQRPDNADTSDIATVQYWWT